MSTIRVDTVLDFSGTAKPANTGKILQVQSATKTDVQSLVGGPSAGNTADISGLSVSITPTNTGSKFLVFGYVGASWDSGRCKTGIRLLRNGSPICIGNEVGDRARLTNYCYINGDGECPICLTFDTLDAPSTTSAVTYNVQLVAMDPQGTIYVNRSERDIDNNIFGRTASTITVMEVA